MRITESQLKRIIAEEAQKFKRGKKINESKEQAENVLADALDEYIDQMTVAGYDPQDICSSVKEFVESFCEAFLTNLGPEDGGY